MCQTGLETLKPVTTLGGTMRYQKGSLGLVILSARFVLSGLCGGS